MSMASIAGRWARKTPTFARSLTGSCPWCAPVAFGTQTRQLAAPIFGGYCGERRICGACGYEGETEDEAPREVSDEDREKNIARVASVPDPKCWKCHDTGDQGMPLDEPDTHPCDCGGADADR